MDKIWLKHYDPGILDTIDPDQYASLPDLLIEAFDKYRDAPCFMNFGETLTYKQVDELSQAYAGFLQTECQLKKGDRVAIMMPNCLQYPVALFGCLRAGMVNVNVSPLYSTVTEVRYVLQHAEVKCILTLANFAHLVQKAISGTHVKHVIVTEIGDLFPLPKRLLFNFVTKFIKKMVPAYYIPNVIPFRETLQPFYQKKFTKPTLGGNDIAYLQFTEGRETGMPKCAILTHRNFIADALQYSAVCHNALLPLAKENALATLPFFKLVTMSIHCLSFMRYGLVNNLITNPRDIDSLIQEIKKHPPAIIVAVRSIFNDLLFQEDFQKLNFSKLKFTYTGGMKIPQALADRWQSITQSVISECYVLTEGSPLITLPPVTLKNFTGALGIPLPLTEVKICNEQGEELPIGSRGEFWIKGPQICKEYWNEPEETQKVFTADGWFKTGDMGYITEEGYLYFIDRKEEIIHISQDIVYPSEVENVLTEINGVEEAVIVAVSQAQQLIIKAYIVKSDPSLSKETVLAHCHRHLSNYQIPTIIEFREALPRSATGYILRRQLREENQDR